MPALPFHPVAHLVALVLSVTAADAAQRRAKPAPPPPPPQFKIDGPTRPMAMERLVLSMPTYAVLGGYVRSDLCSDDNATPGFYFGEKVELTLANAFPGTPPAEFIDAFTAEAAAAGYVVAGRKGSSDLFSSADEKRAERVIGAAIVGLKADACMGTFGGMTAVATITLDWQVFDPLERRLVLRKTLGGNVKLTKDIDRTTAVPTSVLAAFRQASKNILSDPEFIAALKIENATAASATSMPVVVQIPRIAARTATFKDQIPDLRQQVVTILTGTGSGSGFYLADGMIMTNHHVIAGNTTVKVRFYGGRELPGEVVVSDYKRDVAIVKTTGGGVLGLPIQFDRPPVGAAVFVIGSPLGKDQEGTVTSGVVSAHRERDGRPYLQSDVAINPGNSGGPMFDEKGNVVGIVVSGFGETDTGVNFFIPVDDAFRTLGIGVAGVAQPTAVRPQAAGGRVIQVSMYPAGGPLQKSGKVQPITGNVSGVGGAGTFAFTRPDGVTCDGKWTTLNSKPASGSLLDKHRDVVGIGADPAGMTGGLAIGVCSNGGNFQAEYYVVPDADNGFGAAADSDGNIYKVIF